MSSERSCVRAPSAAPATVFLPHPRTVPTHAGTGLELGGASRAPPTRPAAAVALHRRRSAPARPARRSAQGARSTRIGHPGLRRAV
jgi:hypothetical protein